MSPASNGSTDMALTVLLTGFGPFPGAHQNPTGPLVRKLVQLRRPVLEDVRLVAHVFQTSYAAVDRDLPRLLSDVKPDAVLMFGLSARARCLRIEIRARNALSALRDADGKRLPATCILPGGPGALAFPVPGARMALAVRNAGIAAVTSRDPGRYLCNYLSWRAVEAATRAGGPKFAAFIHVPRLRAGGQPRTLGRRRGWQMNDLLRGGAAILLIAVAQTRRPSHMTKT